MGRQQELLEAVVATGTPVVLVVVSGRPLSIEWAARHCAAVLLAWVPGEAGPEAIAETLAGDQNPGGKLPISVPRHVGQIPVSYRHHPSGGRSNWKGDYVDGPADPLWPFGFGRSYTSFELSGPAPGPDADADRRRRGRRGRRRREHRLPGRATRSSSSTSRDPEATVARPVLELRGFRRVGLAPGERRSVSFTLSAEQFAYVGADYRRVVEPGAIRLLVGTSSADLPLDAVVRARRADRPPGRAPAIPHRHGPCLTPGRRSTRPSPSAGSTSGSSDRSWSTWAGRSTAGSTSRSIRPPTTTAGGATCWTSCASWR